MEEKKKKRYFCDFWRKVERPDNYILEIAAVIVFLLSLIIIYAVQYNIYEEPDVGVIVAVLGGVIVVAIFGMTVIPAGIIASRISKKHKEEDRAKDEINFLHKTKSS